MKRVLSIILASFLVVSAASAAWWNPFDWFQPKLTATSQLFTWVFKSGTTFIEPLSGYTPSTTDIWIARTATSTQYCFRDGTCMTTASSGASSGNIFNQWLDTTNTPTFAGLNASTTNVGTLHIYTDFTTDDTGLVTNLNADQLDSQTGAYYLDWDNFTNKPATSTSFLALGDLSDVATTSAPLFSLLALQADGTYDSISTSTFKIAYTDIVGTPSLFSGSWDDLTKKPATSTVLTLLDSDKRISVINATTTNADTLVVYTGSTFPANDIVDSEVSDTLTASDLVAGSSVVADAEVDDNITVTNLKGAWQKYTTLTFPASIITPTTTNASIFVSGHTTTTQSLTVGNLTAADCDVKAVTSLGLLYCGTDATGGGGSGGSNWTNNLRGLMYHTTTSDDILLGGTATTTDVKLEVIGNIKLGGNASTTGYFAVGTGAPLTGMGAGDLFVGDDATITGNFEISGNATTTGVAYLGGLRTGIINDFFDAACSVTNQFATDISDSGTFTCTALDTSGTWSGNAATASDLAGCTDCISTPEIADVYLLNNGDNGTGLFTFSDLRPSVLNATTTNIDTLTLFKGISGNASTTGWFNVGTTDVVSALGALIGAGDIYAAGDATITRTLSATTIEVNDDLITDFTGTNLTVTNGILSASGGGGVNDWVVEFPAPNQALAPTSTNNLTGIFVNASSTITTLRSDSLTVTGLTSGGVVYGGGSAAALTASGVLTNGQLLIGDGSGAPTAAALTDGTAYGIDVVNGAGSIELRVDTTEMDTLTWSDAANASNLWTFDLSGTDPTMLAKSGGFLFGGTGEFEGNASTTGSLVVGTAKGINLVSSGSLFVSGNSRVAGNATTSGWFNVGTTDVVNTLGSLIGAGDLFVGRNATTTGDLTISGGDLNPNGAMLTIGGIATTTATTTIWGAKFYKPNKESPTTTIEFL